jgi:hypothetical protein
MPQFYKMLTPVSTDGQSPLYLLEDVLKPLSAAHRKRLHKWLANGRVTLLLVDEQEAIYEYDLDRFFDTL